MLANERTGNMAAVYAGAQASVEFSNRRAEKDGPYAAQIVPGQEPQWCIVTTQPGEDGVAAGHLAGRGFGVYQPQIRSVEIRRGRKVDVVRNMFPGYLFVFVWGLSQHTRRILGCTGVRDFLRTTGGKPVVVPDELVDHVRAQENRQNPITLPVEAIAKRARRKKRAKTREEQQRLVPVEDNEIVSVSAWSAMRDISELDQDGRISALHVALRLAS